PHPEGKPGRPSDTANLWREWHGVELHRPDWGSWSHTLAWSLHSADRGALLWCGLNAFSKAIHFDLPPPANGWMRVIDTALPNGEDIPSHPEFWSPKGVPLESRSLVLMVAPSLLRSEFSEAGGGNRTRIISLEG
ncbi:MAG: glycogen debranching enzyme, partial [Cyanobium sp.]